MISKNRKLGLGTILILSGALALTACDGGNTPQVTEPTGSVSFNNAASTTVVLTDSAGNVVPASSYNTLKPGNYTATYSRNGYVTQTRAITVTAGSNQVLEVPTLVPVTPPKAPAGAYYRDANGNMVAISSLDPSRFSFNSWMENEAAGIDPTQIGLGNAGTPTAGEQNEVAPSNHQNVIAGYVTYRADDGNTYPVIGAEVRMDILEQTGNVRFSASDDGSLDSGSAQPLSLKPQAINANGLSTVSWTNSAVGSNIPFPASADYPLYNMTGVNTVNTNGFTWATLNHDPMYPNATARVRAIAYIGGQEITKQFLNKTFAPSAKLEILKTVNATNGTIGAPNTYTITVSNTGQGAATNIVLQDRLTNGTAANYTINGVPAGTTAEGTSGFDATAFTLQPGESRTFTFDAQASATGVYCDTATIVSYENGAFGVVNPVDLNDDACVTVRAPRLNIIKTLVDASGNPVTEQTVAAGADVRLRVQLTNGGDLTANNVVVTDVLNSGDAGAYSITTPTGTTANDTDGFNVGAQDIAPGQTVTYDFPARATVDGRYCDTASFTSDNAGTGSAEACFTVATARLAITKTNTPSTNLYPGSSYTSTINVTNTGTATAMNVNVSDIIGKNTGGTYVLYGSGNYTVTGTTQTGSVSFNTTNQTATAQPTTVSIPVGGTLQMVITSTIPAGARAGEYCDTATFSSSNAQPATGQAVACVTVSSYIAQQTQLTDTVDPVKAGVTTTVVAGAVIVEPASNQGATNNVLTFNYGSPDPVNFSSGGVFNYSNARFYYDPAPLRDPQTGAVTSDYTHAGTIEVLPTLSAPTETGQLIATFDPNFVIQPGAVIWIRTDILAPAGTAPGQYHEVMRWTSTGQDNGSTLITQTAEPTTVIY